MGGDQVILRMQKTRFLLAAFTNLFLLLLVQKYPFTACLPFTTFSLLRFSCAPTAD